jgi:hypothetical protein
VAARAFGRGRATAVPWWRVGYNESPLEYLPHELYSWEHRFDDAQREYRTLYCAERKLTALREALADLRPNTNVRADFARFQLEQGYAPDELFMPAREVTESWRREHALVQVCLVCDGALADLDDVKLRNQLESTHADLLLSHGMKHLDISEIRSKTRPVTQAISRDLYDKGAAGLLFRSNLDDGQCVVLFEGRASLVSTDEPQTELIEEIEELEHVCSEFGLILRRP